MTTTTATAAPFTYSVPKVKGPNGYEVVRKDTVTGEKVVVMTYAKRDDARADAARSNRDELAVAEARVAGLPTETEAGAAQAMAESMAVLGVTEDEEGDEVPVLSEEDVEALAGLAEQDDEDEAFDAAVDYVARDAEQAREVIASNAEEAVEVQVTELDGELWDQATAATKQVEESAEPVEAGASTDDVLEAVLALRGLVTLPRTKLAAMVEAGEVDELLGAMDRVRTVLASRTKVRLYASKLVEGQRISLRDLGVVTVTSRVKVEQRKVLVSWVDAAGVAGERVMGSWQWITLA